MLYFFKKRRISRQTLKALEFLKKTLKTDIHEDSPAKASAVLNEESTSIQPEENVRYSLKYDISETPNCGHTHSPDRKYSLKGRGLLNPERDKQKTDPLNGDNYNFSVVSQAMQNYNPTNDTSKVLSILNSATNKTFVDKLIMLMNNKNLRDSEVYKGAQIDRRLFSKIMSDRQYKPSKDTALAIALSLKLNISEALDLISRSGYTLSHSNKRDVLIEYFFREQIFKLDDVNMILYNLGEKTIGR